MCVVFIKLKIFLFFFLMHAGKKKKNWVDEYACCVHHEAAQTGFSRMEEFSKGTFHRPSITQESPSSNDSRSIAQGDVAMVLQAMMAQL